MQWVQKCRSAVSNSVTPQADWTPPEVGDFTVVSCFIYLQKEIRVILQANPRFNCGNRDQVLVYDGTIVKNTITGATKTAIGTGSANTDAIITKQAQQKQITQQGLQEYTGGSYTDWFLPSKMN
jgi:hypothetical protein